MKRILILMVLAVLPMAAWAGRPAKTASQSKIESVVKEFRHCEGVEVVQLGRLATSVMKGVIRLSDISDPDLAVVLSSTKGIKRMTIFDYEDCAPELRERISRKIDRALNHSELLMEAHDDGDQFQLFGTVDERAGVVRDIVLHVPSDGALICFFGYLSMDAISSILTHD